MARVYISSTYEDLKDYRQAVIDTLRIMQLEVIAMEGYVAADERPLSKCLADVERCDYYVGIFARRYGFVPPNHQDTNPKGLSITELEYRHAKDNHKKRFIFFVNKKCRWPIEYVDTGESAVRLEALIQELKNEHMGAAFESEADLANKVAAALLPHMVPTSSTSPRLKLPPFVAKMCNRTGQERQFKDFFRENLQKRAGVPQICFIHGMERECHDSLFKRLYERVIKEVANDQQCEFQGVPMDKALSWPDLGVPMEELQKDLQQKPFAVFESAYRVNRQDFSATALSQLAAQSEKRLIIFHYMIAASLYGKNWKLIKWYLSYWARLEVDLSRPQFVIFLSINYAESPPWVWHKPWRFARPFVKWLTKKRLERTCRKHNVGMPVLLLREVRCVRRQHVVDWFNEYEDQGNFSPEKRLEVLTKLFKTNEDCRSMEVVEIELHRVVAGD